MTPPTDAAVLGGITAESKEYFEKRSLKKGAVNWVLLMSLGIAYVISGDFSGWNYGIGYGGWFGMLIAFLVMGAMYLFMVLGLAEMSSAMPAAGAGYGFARRAMGKVGGALTGFAILIEYTICPAAISTFIAAYVHALGLFADIPSVAIIGFFFIVFCWYPPYWCWRSIKDRIWHYRYCHDRPYRFRCWHCASLRSGESLQYRPCRRWGYGTSAFRCCRCDFCSPIWYLAVPRC